MHICLLQTKIGKAPERIKTCCPGAILNDSSVSLFEHILNRLVLTWTRVEYPSAFLRTKKPCRPPRRIQTFLHFTDENPPLWKQCNISTLLIWNQNFRLRSPPAPLGRFFVKKFGTHPLALLLKAPDFAFDFFNPLVGFDLMILSIINCIESIESSQSFYESAELAEDKAIPNSTKQ